MAHVADGFNDVARAGLALRADHRGTLRDAAQGLAQVARAADERNLEGVLPDVVFLIGGREHLAFVDEVDFQRLEHLRFGEMADANLRHHGDGDRLHDVANDFRRGHPGDTAFLADVGGDAFKRHHRARA
jgi:hypothetical protein